MEINKQEFSQNLRAYLEILKQDPLNKESRRKFKNCIWLSIHYHYSDKILRVIEDYNKLMEEFAIDDKYNLNDYSPE